MAGYLYPHQGVPGRIFGGVIQHHARRRGLSELFTCIGDEGGYSSCNEAFILGYLVPVLAPNMASATSSTHSPPDRVLALNEHCLSKVDLGGPWTSTKAKQSALVVHSLFCGKVFLQVGEAAFT